VFHYCKDAKALLSTAQLRRLSLYINNKPLLQKVIYWLWQFS